MLKLKPTSQPSENIFAKDPIESILEFFAGHCSKPKSHKRGITIPDLSSWEALTLNYLENDLDTAIKTFNYNWKQTI